MGIPLPLEPGKLEQRWASQCKGMSEGSPGSEGGIRYKPKWGSAKRNSQFWAGFFLRKEGARAKRKKDVYP